MADQHQQDVNDQLRLEGGGQPGCLAIGEALLAGLQLAVAGRAVAEIDIDAAEALAADALAADRGEQDGVHGNVQEAAEFPVGEAVLGFGEQAFDGGRERAVAGEVDVADGEQAEAIEAGGIAAGVEAAVVVVAAQVADLAEIAEGGAGRGQPESSLELIEGDGGLGSQQRLQQVRGARGHNAIVSSSVDLVTYTLPHRGPKSAPAAGILSEIKG